jgi:hypothetical protein
VLRHNELAAAGGSQKRAGPEALLTTKHRSKQNPAQNKTRSKQKLTRIKMHAK